MPRPPKTTKGNRRIANLSKHAVTVLLREGQCKANCTLANCPRKMQSIDQFLPAVSNNTHKKRATVIKLVEKVNAISKVDPKNHNARTVDLLSRINAKRSKHCYNCRQSLKRSTRNPSTKYGACFAKWQELKKDLEAKGCIICGCTDGMTVEHTIPNEKKRDKKGNTVSLADYNKWFSLGGAKAMQEEYDKPSVVPMCINCQFMQPTHTAMKPKLNPDDLPDGKQGKKATKEEVAAYKKKHHLLERFKKQAYVEHIKLNWKDKYGQVGMCEECVMEVIPHGSKKQEGWIPAQNGYPHVFQFAHRSELDKKDQISKIVNSALSFETAKPRIDKEVKRCRLLCQCCARTETGQRNDCPGASEEGN